MPISDFYPFQDNQKVTAAQWNALFTAIANGEFFLDESFVSEEIQNLAARVTSLEIRIDYIYNLKARQRKRQQFILTDNQESVMLDSVPLIDSETVSLNGQVWSKSGIPEGFVGDYSLSGKTLTFNPEQSTLMVAGDIFVVTYEFEVP